MKLDLLRGSMVVEVVVVDPFDPLCLQVMQRGMFAGITFFVSETDRVKIEPLLKAELHALPHALSLHAQAPLESVVLSSGEREAPPTWAEAPTLYLRRQDESPASGKGVNLVIHDMLPDSRGKRGAFFESWNSGTSGDQQPLLDESGGYWCSINDVSSAVVQLLPHLASLEQTTYHVAGRRYWTMEETWNEFAILARRANAGRLGAFNVDVLTDDEGLPVEVQPVDQQSSNPQRPDIAPFHRCLKQYTGEGWRPMMPLRQTLMLVLASLDPHS